MKRSRPFSSLIGYIFTVLLLAGLALAVWRTGGKAFSPGRLSAKSISGYELSGYASHADFEARCSLCHAPLQTTQEVLCEACHTDVADQTRQGSGTHGQIQSVNRCATCHADHRGKNFDPALASHASFDHSRTRFSLLWHQVGYDTVPMDCAACHTTQNNFSVAAEKCFGCHASHDAQFMAQHIQDFGDNCLACHDGLDRMVGFDHSSTAFPLDGKHSSVRCADCHKAVVASPGSNSGSSLLVADVFKNTPRDCAQCHAEPDAHRSVFDQNCTHCHSAAGWSPASLDGKPFDHSVTAHFSLARHARDFNGLVMTCEDCHPSGVQNFDMKICVDCHSKDHRQPVFMRQHLAKFGAACLDCHDGADRMHNFDHANFFVLDGAHAPLACEACHANKVFKEIPVECVKCHAEPVIHKGFFGLQCHNCHTTQAWAPARMQVHTFPLDHGGHGALDCKTCHSGAYTQYTCYSCHDHQPDEIRLSHTRIGIAPQVLPDCAQCHPSGSKNEAQPATIQPLP
jgi:hypothetical protein